MNSEKLIEVFRGYRCKLSEDAIQACQIGDYRAEASAFGAKETLGHISWMCEEAISLVNQGRLEKAFRWLGFIQGVLWMSGINSIDDLKEHSRSK